MINRSDCNIYSIKTIKSKNAVHQVNSIGNIQSENKSIVLKIGYVTIENLKKLSFITQRLIDLKRNTKKRQWKLRIAMYNFNNCGSSKSSDSSSKITTMFIIISNTHSFMPQ